jgi:ribonuclease-3
VSGLTVIFRTQSPIEARIVKGLLDTHGITSLVSSDAPHSVFPLSVDGMGEVRLAVRAEEAAEAERVIAEHRTDPGSGRLVRLRDEYESLQQRLAYRFRDRGLLEHALTHRSRAHEDVSGGVVDNESLEFLGDAVIGFLVADLLFREFPELDEGQKSKMKASLVSTTSLARLGEQLELGEHLILGRGEEKTGGRRKQALLADAYEALVAAVYLDGGLEAVRTFVTRQFREHLDELRRSGLAGVTSDYKSALQEWLQSRNRPLPAYRVTAEVGPDHRKLFQVEVRVGGNALAASEGRSKKEAEQQAARAALEKLEAGMSPG